MYKDNKDKRGALRLSVQALAAGVTRTPHVLLGSVISIAQSQSVFTAHF
jgi:hypothetical protein